MKFGFVTCVTLGLACMEEIYRIGGKLDLIISLKDNLAQQKSGRINVEDFCTEHEIDLVKVRNVNDPEAVQAIRGHQIDWLFIIGWSQIARRSVLDAPKSGCLGMHPTLLPQGRGRASIPWAILKGLDETGVTLFKLDDGVDTGPIVAQEVVPIERDETATTLYARVVTAHQTLMARTWPQLAANTMTLRQQDDSQASEWPGRKPEDGLICPEMDCIAVDRLVRAVTHPYPGAFLMQEAARYTIWKGCVHVGCPGPELPTADGENHLLFKLVDGSYEATDWEHATKDSQ